MEVTNPNVDLKRSDFTLDIQSELPERVTCDITADCRRDFFGKIEVEITRVIDQRNGEDISIFLKFDSEERLKPVMKSYYLSDRMHRREAVI